MAWNGRSAPSNDARRLVERMLLRWPNHRKDAAQLEMHARGVDKLIEERGVSCVEAAVEAAFTRCHYFAEPDELRDLLPSADQFAQHRDPNCCECLGSGVKTVEVTADPRHLELYPGEKTMRVARRCHCEPATRKNESLEVENVG